MTQWKAYILFIIIVLYFDEIYGQAKFRIIPWKTENGLSGGRVTALLKDKRGFLWAGTPIGLNRFDGDKFKSYFHDKTNSNTILDDYITNLVEDSLHNIWLGTSKGLSRYSLQADNFKNFPSKASANSQQMFTIPFWATKDEIFCIEPSIGITAYDIRSLNKRTLTHWIPDQIVNDHVRLTHCIFDDYTNSVWGVDEDLVQLSLTDNKEYRYKINGGTTCQVLDKKRRGIWIGGHRGLTFFSLADKNQYPSVTLNKEIINKSFDEISSIATDLKGNMWMGVNYANGTVGLAVFNPSTESIYMTCYEPGKQNSISSPSVYGVIYCDRVGMTWAAKYDDSGLDQIVSFPAVATNYLPDPKKIGASENNIFCLANGKDNRLWLGTSYGILEFNPITGSFKRIIEHNSVNNQSLIVSLAVDTILQKTWVGTVGGIIEINNSTHQQRAILYKDSAGNVIHEPSPPSIIAQNNTECFIQVFNQGIFTFKKGDTVATKKVVTGRKLVTHVANVGTSLFFLRVFGESANLTYLYDKGKWTLDKSPFDSIEWSSIYYDDKDETFWVGARARLYHYNKNYQLLTEYNDKDGMPPIDVLAIEKDNNGQIWIITNNHVSRLDQHTGKFVTLSTTDGLPKHGYSWRPPLLKDRDGDIFLGSSDGIDKIEPPNLLDYPPSSVYFKSLEVNYKPYQSEIGINDIRRLDLKYFQNSFSIETGVVDYYSHNSNSIRYKLEGLKDEWQYAPVNYLIRYGGLSPNSYKLIIQSSNGNNDWLASEKDIFITINPAFWNTWWFRMLAIASIFTAFYFFIRSRWQNRFRIQMERSEKERLLVEMRQKATELEMSALRSQMNPHFIFNSLNSINMFILENNKLQASEYLSKFSKLVRFILQNSEETFISLERELQALGLYLELESLRFDQKFDYDIKVSDELDTNGLKVPPLIIQPYAENAIWHGLMPKKEKGHLEIDIYANEELLYYKITDNGIGRRKHASELEGISSSRKKSMGMRITADRIAMLQQQNKTSITITDLVLADGNPGGTEILIKIPVSYG